MHDVTSADGAIAESDGSDDLVAQYILRSNSTSPDVTISEYYYVPTNEDLEPDMVAFDPSRADFRNAREL